MRAKPSAEPIRFLSVAAATGKTAEMPRKTALAAARRWRGAGRRLREGLSSDDLSEAGWGLVEPAGGDRAIRDALAPLIERRREQAGELYQELIYRRGEGAADFRSRLRSGIGPVDPRKIPYYLLLLGDAEEIPHGFQAGLDVPHAVGRLHLPSLEAYRRYAETVVAHERRAPGASPRLGVWSPTHDNDAGTRQCAGTLASGLVAHFADRRGGQLEGAVVGRTATRARFLDLLAAPRAGVLLTVGHGVMYSAGQPAQRDLQGALVAAEWPGGGRPTEMDDLIEPGILPAAIDPRVLFLFGCYTGGTPRLHGYDEVPRARRRPVADAPFLARLPQTLLERGALAVVAHVDQATPDAFRWEKHGQIEVFQDCLAALLDGRRVGYAMEPFAERYAAIATEMVEGTQEMGDDDVAALGLKLWMAYNDARGMVVLGDPAVRLGGEAGTAAP